MALENRWNHPASLSLRVTALVGITTTICLLVVGLIIQQSIDRHFAEQDAEELQIVADAVRSSLSSTGSDLDNVDIATLLQSAMSGHLGIYFMVAEENGSILYSMPGPDLSSIVDRAGLVEVIDSDALFSWMADEQTFRGAVLNINVPMENSGAQASRLFTVTVAAAMNFHMNFMQSFNNTLWGIMIVASLITIFAAWVAVVQGHAPLRYVSSRIRSVGHDHLDLRLETDQVPAELVELVSSFNDMIERMEDAFHRLSNFSADIAHELRTPITNITTQTQVALNKSRSTEEYREILYSNLEEYERMAKMVNDLLMLAKTENGLLKPTFAKLDLSIEAAELLDYFEALAEEKGISLVLTGQCELIRGDRSMIRRALSNFLSNAIRYTPEGGSVHMKLDTAGDNAFVTIENPGLDIPQEYLPKLFDRFYRADPSRQGDGVGLGLAIAKSIIDIHNGTILVSSSNGTTIFSISLPTIGQS